VKVKHRVSKDVLKEDRFQKFVEKAAEFYYENPRRFWIGVGVGLFVIVGVILLVQNRPRPMRNAEAELRLMDALSNLYQGNLGYAERALNELAGSFPKDYAGIRAHHYLGLVYFSSQPPRLAEAKREFETFLRKAKRDPVLTPAAKMGIAACEEQLENYSRAAEIYEAVYNQYRTMPLGFEALLGAGRCYREAGLLDKAEEIYRSYLKDHNIPVDKADEVKIRLAYIEALKSKF